MTILWKYIDLQHKPVHTELVEVSAWTSTLLQYCLRMFISLFVLLLPVVSSQANDMPEVTPALKNLLGGLPIGAMKDDLQKMVGALKNTTCGGGLKGCYMTSSGPMQLYFFTGNNTQQTLLLVIDQKMAMPSILKKEVQNLFGGTLLQTPIFSISTTDYRLDFQKMPPPLQKIVQERYFNVASFDFTSGVQIFSRADINGAMRIAIESLGVRGNAMVLKAGVVMPIPTDLAGGAGTGAGAADAVAQGDTMKKAAGDALRPEAYAEIQFAPNTTLNFGLPNMRLSDATFFINNSLTFGYKGNAAFSGATDKKTLLQFQTPLTPAGAMDLADFSFRMALPASFSLEDAANIVIAMASPDPRLAKYGGGFVRNIESIKKPLQMAVKPLSVFQMKNPVPPAEYRFGDRTKPFPTDPKYFNVILLGPLADDGPMIKYTSDSTILGQKFGMMDVFGDIHGFSGKVVNNIGLKLGPLGSVTIQKMIAEATIDKSTQMIRLKGNYFGQTVEIILDGTTLSIEVAANCANPFEIKAKLGFTPSTNIADVFQAQGGVSVDPAKLPNCVGKELEAAYNKIAKEYKNLGGFSADEANKALKKIADDAAALAAKEAQAAYDAAKNQARDLANKSTSSAKKTFDSVGNSISKGATDVAVKAAGGSTAKVHKPSEDELMFDPSVFNWDYYYDTRGTAWGKTDLFEYWKNTGYPKGEQASNEFNLNFYRNKYNVKGSSKDVMYDWTTLGAWYFRQGSPSFSLEAYRKRYSDLSKMNGYDLMKHWLEHGRYEGRNARP